MIAIEDIPEDQILFYDIETDHQHAAYAELQMIGVQYGFEGEGQYLTDQSDLNRFKDRMKSRDILKVGFNCFNFDNIVLDRFGYPVEFEGNEDGFFMAKTLCPSLPSYNLKFINFWFLGDPHFEEIELKRWMKKMGVTWEQTPLPKKKKYLQRDLLQHCNVFRLFWNDIIVPDRWEPYQLERSQGPLVKEMALQGGVYIDLNECNKKIDSMLETKASLTDAAEIMSDGRVTNPNSSRQMGAYLNEEGFELELSSNGEFAVRKADLLDIREHDPVAECAFEIRKINGTLKYFENYARAVADPRYAIRGHYLPVCVSASAAGTRRYISSSYYGINFQNPNEEAKTVQVVPDGWLGVWFDSTQIENVVHIYESEDDARRAAYEADPDWSEYVWLCNRILGGKPRSKKELDSIPSPQIPNWSIYKQFKTAKLALNFGMGVRKFCATTGVSQEKGQATFDTIHEACPAIRYLQTKVARLVSKFGYVEDPFGHRYTGKVSAAYKIVAYLVQGTGTASVPKAHMRDNRETIHRHDRKNFMGGVMCSTTHDENHFRLNLELGFKSIYSILQECNYNMTDKYSPKFGGIPLRAKCYLSKTTAANHIEVDLTDEEWIKTIVEGKPCETCQGSGSPDHGKTNCPTCSGRGYVRNQPASLSDRTNPEKNRIAKLFNRQASERETIRSN